MYFVLKNINWFGEKWKSREEIFGNYETRDIVGQSSKNRMLAIKVDFQKNNI